MTNWIRLLDSWRVLTSIRTYAPASAASLSLMREHLKDLPAVLEDFYKTTNGLMAGSLKVLPVEDSADMKRTWDSIQRANDPQLTRFLGRSAQLLGRFIVFADIGVGRAGAFDREDGSVWYEEEGQLRHTDLSLDGFLEANLREIAES